MELGRHVDEILTLVSVLLRRLPALVTRVEGVAEHVELRAGVVQVVLAVHLGALGREEIRDRVADRDPPPATGVQRPGGVGRDELEVDPAPLEHRRAAVPLSLLNNPTEHIVQPGGCEEEIEEPRPGDLDPGKMRDSLRLERVLHALGDLARVPADLSLQLERHVGRPVAVVPAAGRLQADAAGGLRKPGRVECAGQRGTKVVSDHGGDITKAGTESAR